jgi:hypothetical protein
MGHLMKAKGFVEMDKLVKDSGKKDRDGDRGFVLTLVRSEVS